MGWACAGAFDQSINTLPIPFANEESKGPQLPLTEVLCSEPSPVPAAFLSHLNLLPAPSTLGQVHSHLCLGEVASSHRKVY